MGEVIQATKEFFQAGGKLVVSVVKKIKKLLDKLFNAIHSFIISTINKIENIIEMAVDGLITGCKMIQKYGRIIYQQLTTYFYQLGTNWEEVVVTKEIEENEVPASVLKRAKTIEMETEFDITDLYALELKQAH